MAEARDAAHDEGCLGALRHSLEPKGERLTRAFSAFVADTPSGSWPENVTKNAKTIIFDTFGVALARTLGGANDYGLCRGGRTDSGGGDNYRRQYARLAGNGRAREWNARQCARFQRESFAYRHACLAGDSQSRRTRPPFWQGRVGRVRGRLRGGHALCGMFRQRARRSTGTHVSRLVACRTRWTDRRCNGGIAPPRSQPRPDRDRDGYSSASSSCGGFVATWARWQSRCIRGMRRARAFKARFWRKRASLPIRIYWKRPWASWKLCAVRARAIGSATARLGNPFVLERGMRIKPYPSCARAHPGLDAILLLQREVNFSDEDVESIEADLEPFSLLRPNPHDEDEAGFSGAFLFAAAIVNRALGLDQISERTIHDPRVIASNASIQ